ncbi:transposase IS116/IS110/IS902 [Shinella sp. DD12]|nr:transposase IS116/IS110/IS902 [Shinella sp. DD12]
MRRVIGMDIHRTFAEVVFWEEGRLRHHGRVDMTRSGLEGFGRSLEGNEEIVVEATGNTMSVVRVLSPFAARVIVANPMQVKAIAHARIKTDKIDAGVLAQLQASGFLPEVWVPDERTERLRRLVARRSQVVRHRTRVKNEVHAILQAHLVPKCPHADLFNKRGRDWLSRQEVPDDERTAITRHVREIDRLADDLADLDGDIAKDTVDDADVQRLLTIAGVNAVVAAGIVAAIGDISRFSEPQKLVSYFGLNPRVRQSGLGLAQYGRISKHGRSHARGLLVEAAWAASKAPGPLRAFFLRIRNRRGHQVAAVATARKLVVLIWHLLIKKQDYLWLRPSLVAAKRRQLELKAGAPSEKGKGRRGAAYAYNLKDLRTREREGSERAEKAYEQMVRHWRTQGTRPKGRTDAKSEERQ